MEKKKEQETADFKHKRGNPENETVTYKVGGTFYVVSTSCGGSEPLYDKMKRLITVLLTPCFSLMTAFPE